MSRANRLARPRAGRGDHVERTRRHPPVVSTDSGQAPPPPTRRELSICLADIPATSKQHTRARPGSDTTTKATAFPDRYAEPSCTAQYAAGQRTARKPADQQPATELEVARRDERERQTCVRRPACERAAGTTRSAAAGEGDSIDHRTPRAGLTHSERCSCGRNLDRAEPLRPASHPEAATSIRPPPSRCDHRQDSSETGALALI